MARRLKGRAARWSLARSDHLVRLLASANRRASKGVEGRFVMNTQVAARSRAACTRCASTAPMVGRTRYTVVGVGSGASWRGRPRVARWVTCVSATTVASP